eukprot:2347604-Pyramimonas_sp.AAC.1
MGGAGYRLERGGWAHTFVSVSSVRGAATVLPAWPRRQTPAGPPGRLARLRELALAKSNSALTAARWACEVM